MDHVSENLIYVHERRLPYETFDADNHLYETQDALTKFLPPEYEGAVKYVEVGGRTKLAICGITSPSTSRTPRSTGSRCRAATAATSRRAVTAVPSPARPPA